MIIIKKVFVFLGDLGKICSIFITLFLISTLLVSLSIKNDEVTNPYCKIGNEKKVILSSKYIEKYDSFYSCNTIYINILANDSLNVDSINEFKKELIKQLETIKDYFIHIEIDGKNIDLTYFCFKN